MTTPIDDAMTDAANWDRAATGFGPPRAGGGRVNVGRTERLLSTVAGALLVGAGLGRGRGRGLLVPLGGALLFRGVSGFCPGNYLIGRNSAETGRTSPVASVGRGRGIKVEESVTIARRPEELFRFWRDFRNLPRFMEHLESVTVIDANRSRWVAKGPGGSRVEWEAEIHNEIENELIAWRSVGDADVNNAGSVHFRAAPGGGTEVRVVLSYEPPAHTGRLGQAIARLFGEEPGQQVREDLGRFKQVMEAGVAATAAGQPHDAR
jgi:uncharacterized membrane protein